ncbi:MULTISPECIES: DUF1015 domain-containing protein [unclassified Kaistella]|uniref:DUF1015 domain-containing protein n=1 Tax=unclassified Kaistella TaxID=2762626 RepID=UPI002734BA69|nr:MULTISPECIES: DUF1015 domain-containing protein [unclassified Kaistella]MCZ2082800.1 DUF1015 domain-containing protein [Flavobacteriales bacterium]MDP2454695.1 DUF1015 domain-containing protein [Kaistella sp. SH11-4b]MDP2457432.1 DUF1015 domain-containing protein [Kaistella sp. SH40-3]MDP2460192.1 DUF1015 domain-containing protein [Kaistella sp. SH19-2b]
MPIFKPFRGIRPSEDYVEIFPTHPLDNFSQEEINKKSQTDSSYIQMIKPYVVSKSKDIDRNLRKIRTNFEELLDARKLVRDNSSYYLYSQILPNKTVFRGLLGLVSVDDFKHGKIKKHESTLTQKKEKLSYYLDKVNVQAEPVLLTYMANPKVEMLMNHEEKNVPILNYVDDNGTRHKVWQIDNRLKMLQFKEVLEQIDSFYIADGHHRIGSTALNAENQKNKNKKHNGTELYNYVFSYVVSNQSIKIHDYNRLLEDLNGLSEKEFIAAIEKNFLIHEKGDQPYYPSQKFHISMYLGGKFYSLHVKHELRKQQSSMNDLDHFLLEEFIIKDILGISDPKTTEKITYIKGTSNVEGINRIKESVDSGQYKVGFGIHPVSFNDLLKVSNHKIIMPPKCTYIEPKLVTALIMFDMKQ